LRSPEFADQVCAARPENGNTSHLPALINLVISRPLASKTLIADELADPGDTTDLGRHPPDGPLSCGRDMPVQKSEG
jgi:hypothetical protein